jgi:hypothetical protein
VDLGEKRLVKFPVRVSALLAALSVGIDVVDARDVPETERQFRLCHQVEKLRAL